MAKDDFRLSKDIFPTRHNFQMIFSEISSFCNDVAVAYLIGKCQDNSWNKCSSRAAKMICLQSLKNADNHT